MSSFEGLRLEDACVDQKVFIKVRKVQRWSLNSMRIYFVQGQQTVGKDYV